MARLRSASLPCTPVRRDRTVRLIGGKRLDQSFLADLPVAPGMQIGLYSDASSVTTTVNLGTGASTPALTAFDPARLLGPNGDGCPARRTIRA